VRKEKKTAGRPKAKGEEEVVNRLTIRRFALEVKNR